MKYSCTVCGAKLVDRWMEYGKCAMGHWARILGLH